MVHAEAAWAVAGRPRYSLDLGAWVLSPMALSYPRATGGRLQQHGGSRLLRSRRDELRLGRRALTYISRIPMPVRIHGQPAEARLQG